MPTRMTKPKITTFDSFSTWLSGTVPDGVELRIFVHQYLSRNQGYTHAYVSYTVELTRGAACLEKKSHNLAALASWVTCIALPELFPPPRPPERPLRKITVDRPKLEHRPIVKATDLRD